MNRILMWMHLHQDALIGLVAVSWAVYMGVRSLSFPGPEPGSIGPGFFPRMVALCLGILGILMILNSFLRCRVLLVIPESKGGGIDSFTERVARLLKTLMDREVLVVHIPVTGGKKRSRLESNPYLIQMRQALWIDGDIVTDDHVSPAEWVLLIDRSPCALFIQSEDSKERLKTWISKMRDKGDPIRLGIDKLEGIGGKVLHAFEKEIELDVVPQAFPSGFPARLEALIRGDVDALLDLIASGGNQMMGGRIQALSVFEDERLREFDAIPTAKEQGVKLNASIIHYLVMSKKQEGTLRQGLEEWRKSRSSQELFEDEGRLLDLEKNLQAALSAENEIECQTMREGMRRSLWADLSKSRLAVLTALTILYGWGFEYCGFFFATIIYLFLLIVLFDIGQRVHRFSKAIFVASLITALIYLVFKVFLHVPLPRFFS